MQMMSKEIELQENGILQLTRLRMWQGGLNSTNELQVRPTTEAQAGLILGYNIAGISLQWDN